MRWKRVWLGMTALLLAACSSSSRITGHEDAGHDSDAGTSGSGSGGTAGSAGSAEGGSGTVGSGSSGSYGAGGSGGSAGASGSAGTEASGGSAGAGGCVLTDVTVDFAAQGHEARARFDQKGVSVVGIADLQFSDRAAAEPDAGLGVVGGSFDWSIDSTEFVTFTFARPAVNVSIFVSHALDINNDGVYGKGTVTGYDAAGQQIDQFEFAGYGAKNISALFGDVTLSKFTIRNDVDGIAIGTLSFTECLD